MSTLHQGRATVRRNFTQEPASLKRKTDHSKLVAHGSFTVFVTLQMPIAIAHGQLRALCIWYFNEQKINLQCFYFGADKSAMSVFCFPLQSIHR